MLLGCMTFRVEPLLDGVDGLLTDEVEGLFRVHGVRVEVDACRDVFDGWFVEEEGGLFKVGRTDDMSQDGILHVYEAPSLEVLTDKTLSATFSFNTLRWPT